MDSRQKKLLKCWKHRLMGHSGGNLKDNTREMWTAESWLLSLVFFFGGGGELGGRTLNQKQGYGPVFDILAKLPTSYPHPENLPEAEF